jgi:hypothetical protein
LLLGPQQALRELKAEYRAFLYVLATAPLDSAETRITWILRKIVEE